MESKIEIITPEIAKEYLKHNRRNRKVKPRAVDAYARDMSRGRFLTTHQGIAFYEDGELFDGQHRLLAIIKSGRPAKIMVTRGLPREAMYAVDRGVSRSVGDVISIGHESADSLTNQKIISGLSQLVNCNFRSGMRMTVDDIDRLYTAFGSDIDKVYENIVSKFGFSSRAPMVAAAIAAVNCGTNIDAVTKFFCVFCKDDVSGCGAYNVQAALNWKRQIDDAKIHKVSIDKKKLYLGTQNAIWHFANNTDVSRVVSPNAPRYDVGAKIEAALFPA